MKISRNTSAFLAALPLLAASLPALAKTVEMDVNGLVCGFCAQGIEKTLRGFPATQAVYVNLEHHLVAVELKAGADIDDAALRKALTDSGYTVKAIRRTDEPVDAIRKRARRDE